MGCGEVSAATTVHPVPIAKQHSDTHHLTPAQVRSQLVTIQTPPQPTEIQPAKEQVKKQVITLPPLKQSHKPVLSLAYSHNQLHHPQTTQSQIVEILKEKPDQKIQFEKAEELCKKKEYAEALKLYKKINFEDSYIYTKRGYCNYQQQIYDKALQEYLLSLKLKSDHMPTYFRLGMTYYYKQDYTKALEMFEKCLTLDRNPQVYFKIGLCHFYKQSYDKSLQFYKVALENNKENSEILKAVADTYFQKGNYKQSIDHLKKIIQSEPKNAKILCQIGFCYYSMAQYTEAQTWFEKSLAINKKDPLTISRLAQNYVWMENYDIAIEQYQLCIQLDPKNESYHIQIGACKRYQQLYDQAIESYKKALKINSKNVQIYLGLANVFYQQEKYQQAISQCKKGIKIDPQSSNLYTLMSDCYYQNEQYEPAIENYKLALSKKQANISYLNFMIAKSYYYNQMLIQALPFFQQAIKLSPSSLLYQVQHGKCLFQLQNFSESFKVFTKAKQIYQSTKNKADLNQDDTGESDYWVQELNKFIESAAEWEQKKKIGYVSPQDKEQIKKMRKNFEKKYQAIFGVQSADKKEAKTKPVDKQFLEVAALIHKDKFSLDISLASQSPIFKIASLVRNIYNSDAGAFQIFAYIFQEFMWLQKFEFKKSIPDIENSLNKVLQMLSDKYPPVAKSEKSPDKPVEFPPYKEIKMNLFTEAAYFQQYYGLVNQIEKINLRAKNDLAPFKQFVYTLQKDYKGNHAKVGMKLPQKKENMTEPQKDKYQQSLFKVLIRIFQKMFKQMAKKKDELLQTIDKKIKEGKKIPLYAVNQIIMNTWISSINEILGDRKENGVKTECYISDLVRGKCMFLNVQAIQNAAHGVIKMCKEKGYQIMQLDNRLLKITQDIVFKIKIKEVVSELQLALQFDTVAFEFGHNFYQIQRCPLGCIFGSSLFLTKDVSESFLKQIANSIEYVKSVKPVDKENLKSLEFVMDSFKYSSKTHHF